MFKWTALFIIAAFLLAGCGSQKTPGGGGGTLSGMVSAPSGGDVVDTVVAACFPQGNSCDPNRSSSITVQQSGPSATFTLPNLPSGQYYVIAAKDVNGSGALDAGDYYGVYTADGQNAAPVSPPQSGLSVRMTVVGSGQNSGGDISGTISFLNTPRRAQAAPRLAPKLTLQPPAVAHGITAAQTTSQGQPPAINASITNDLHANEQARWVPGEVIVKFKSDSGLSPQSLKTLRQGNLTLNLVRPLGLGGTRLYHTTGLSEAATLQLAQSLSARADVLYAQPNYILHTLKTPNDEYYAPYQWDLPLMNLPAAWDQTTGSSSTVVAVIDTGILWEAGDPSMTHPDLAGKVLPGYDFISDPQEANDGDGRDPDPYDAGDEEVPGQSSYHGSHVAGTIGAATNNNIGVAGVDWGAMILPVRALGVGGGTTSDILDGALWAAGISVNGVPDNSHPAAVENLSLGGPGTCSPAEQDTFDQITARGVVVVVAAGNDGQDANGSNPANCSGVITVGAVGPQGSRAYYSNYGSKVDVMAPGGDQSSDPHDGVLSTIRDDSTGQFTYAWYQGTSMATPHVAGLVALMKGLEPSLTPAQVLSILKTTAHPLNADQCNRPTGADCGAGLIDAAAALQAVSNPPSQGDFSLTLSPNALTIAPGGSGNLTLTVTPSGGFGDKVNLSLLNMPNGLSGRLSNINGYSATLTISVASSVQAGTYTLSVQASGGGSTHKVPLRLTVGGTEDVVGTYVIACYIQGDGCNDNLSKLVEIGQSGSSAPYKLSQLAAGQYEIVAWKDVNGNGQVDDGDYGGFYGENSQNATPTPVTPPASGIDMGLVLFSNSSSNNVRAVARVTEQLWLRQNMNLFMHPSP
jgi:serine protease